MRFPREWFFPLVAFAIAMGATLIIRNGTMRARPPQPPTPLTVTVGVVNHVLYGHGCPRAALDAKTMGCEFDGLRIAMTLTCTVTGESLSTSMVRGESGKSSDFRILEKCGDNTVVQWKSGKITFGLKGLKLRLLSRDPDKVLALTCREGVNGALNDASHAIPPLSTRPPHENNPPGSAIHDSR